MKTSTEGSFLGINIGGTRSSVVVGTARGEILARTEAPTRAAEGCEAVLASLFEMAAALARAHAPRGVGVAIGGPLDTREGRVLGPPNLPGWDNVPLRARLEEALGLPVVVAHDAAACALAELRFGPAPELRSLVYLTCGTGFGAGLVVDGRILPGVAGRHPEIGHWRLQDDGPEAFGKVGCAEAMCSGPGLSRLAAWLFAARWSEAPPTPEAVSALAAGGDRDAATVLAFHARKTGEVCAKIAELLCPEVIVLGSLARHLGDPWVQAVIAGFEAEVLPRIGAVVTVRPAWLGDRLQDLSALVVALPPRP